MAFLFVKEIGTGDSGKWKSTRDVDIARVLFCGSKEKFYQPDKDVLSLRF
jgi:hypothetical protein